MELAIRTVRKFTKQTSRFSSISVGSTVTPVIAKVTEKLKTISAADSPLSLNFFDRRIYLRRSKREKLEKIDISILEKHCQLLKSLENDAEHVSLNEIEIDSLHPLSSLAQSTKLIVQHCSPKVDNIELLRLIEVHIISQLDNFRSDMVEFRTFNSENAANTPNRNLWNCQTFLRLSLLREYKICLQQAMQDGDINLNDISRIKLMSIIDAYLLGNSSDRILEHFDIYGASNGGKLSQFQVQSCFYTLFDAEIAVASKSFLLISGLQKDHLKKFPKFNKDYLLDTFELNTKARCVFSWSEPSYTGFKPLPDDHLMPISDLIKGRRNFFKEGDSMAIKFLSDYLSQRRLFYLDRQEFRDYLKMGTAFFVGVCIIDEFITTM